MRVAWVTPSPPDRDGGGGQIRQAHLLLALARSAEVALLTAGTVVDEEVLLAVSELVEVAEPTVDGARWKRRIDDLRGALVGSQSREERALGALRAQLGLALDAVAADVVMVEYAGLAPLVDRPSAHREPSPARWILTLHNLPSRMAQQQAAVMPHRRQRWLFRRDAARARLRELAAIGGYDRVITVSDADAAALGGGPRIDVVANGVDLARFVPGPLPPAPRIVFSGALYTAPNTDAARWLCVTVLPLIRVARPDATVDIVGARPPTEVRDLARLPGVRVHPDVDSVVPHLEAARVAVVPIRIGSGTRLKALEAWAAGRPVVGTTIGLEGLGAQDGRDALMADDAESFAAAVVRLLGDDRLAQHLTAGGRALVEAGYSWETQGRRLTGIVDAEAAHRS